MFQLRHYDAPLLDFEMIDDPLDGQFCRIRKSYAERIQLFPIGLKAEDAVHARFVNNARSGLLDGVQCPEAKPEAKNNVTKWTVQHEYNVSGTGNVGGSGSGAKGGVALTGGFKSSVSKTYETQDIEWKLYNQGNTINWQYANTKIPERDSPLWKLTYPAELSTSTYQPAQYFIWAVPTSKRSEYSSYRSWVAANIAGTYSVRSGSWYPRHWAGLVQDIQYITLPKPPLLCIEKLSVLFDSKPGMQEIAVYSQGHWNIEREGDYDWLHLNYTTPDTALIISVNANNTPYSRQAKLKVYRDGQTTSEKLDETIVTVTQAPGK